MKASYKNFLIFGLLLFGFLGFLDTSFLTIEHFRGEVPPCTITHGCQSVTTSVYSKIFGVPVALLGLLYYTSILLGVILYFDTRDEKILKILARYTVLGFLFSLWFTFLQAFIIRAWCQYCLLSAVTSTSLFIIGVIYLKRRDKEMVEKITKLP
jgi:uncharacterized membrane protein